MLSAKGGGPFEALEFKLRRLGLSLADAAETVDLQSDDQLGDARRRPEYLHALDRAGLSQADLLPKRIRTKASPAPYDEVELLLPFAHLWNAIAE